jgi:hypothetical protein
LQCSLPLPLPLPSCYQKIKSNTTKAHPVSIAKGNLRWNITLIYAWELSLTHVPPMQ